MMTDLETFRLEARAWLQSHAARFGREARANLDEAEDLALGRRWQRLKADNGYAAVALPTQYGGGGRSALEAAAFAEEESTFGFPTHFFGISLGQPIPIMLAYAPEEVKQRVAPPAIRGETIWCQLFSEPSAGSDLAAVRLRAERDGDDWILDGQKLWTSWAQYSDYGVILARSDPSLPKHKGLTYFWIDMKSPGITVRPVKLASGAHDVNEVFFDKVRVPDAQRLGPVDGGFGVALHTLTIERYTAADPTGHGPEPKQFLDLARTATLGSRPAIEDGRVRSEFATAFRQQKALAAARARALMAAEAGLEPGAEGALFKLVATRVRQRLSAAAMDLMGTAGAELVPGSSNRDSWSCSWLTVPTLRIAGGADEMLLNNIAERILGLPQDHRPDKAVPFNQIKPSR